MESIGPQLEKGFTTICIKPSQFVDAGDQMGYLDFLESPPERRGESGWVRGSLSIE